jgi:tetratricopeptide (TPR) repeat protein
MTVVSPRRAGQELLGRDRENAELVAGLEDALDGHGRLFLIAGEPGIGKTRLAEQLAAHAAGRGARVVWGRCWEGGGAPPYWPWAQIVRAMAESTDDQSLASWLGSGAAFVSQLAPDLSARLGTMTGTSVPSIESDATRFYLFEATASFLKRAAAAQPSLLVLEDLHAADDPSLLLLRYLARDLRSAGLLIVGTYRDVEVWRSPGISESLSELVRDGQLMTLRGLARDDVKGLIGDLVGSAPSVAVVRAVHETTEGNPLFVREAVRLLASEGRIGQSSKPSVPIPSTVRTLIQQRLAALSADAVQVLSVAAVVGREFDLALVGPACDLPTERILGAISASLSLGVVAEESAALGRYRFSDALMREVIYETLPIPARAGLHRAVGEAIERLYGTSTDSHVAELSRHFAEAASTGEHARALAYARRAGDRAMQSYAYEEAVAEYQRALRALDLAAPDEALRCEILLRMGAAQVRAGRYPEAKEIHMRAAEVARSLGAADQLARAAIGYGEPQVEGGRVNRVLVDLLREALDALSDQDTPLRARTLARLSMELTFSDDVQLKDALSREAVEMARRLGDVTALGAALDARWMAIWGPDGLDERAALSEEILRLAQQTGNRDLELLGREQRAATSLEAGNILAVDTDLAAHAQLADELRMPVYLWSMTTIRATRALLTGAFEEAERLAETARALQPERRNARWANVLELSILRWEQGRLRELQEAWQPLVDQYPRLAVARAWHSLGEIERIEQGEQGNLESVRFAHHQMVEQIPHRPRNGLWLQGLALTSLVTARLDDAPAAQALYPLLRPYAGQFITMNMEQPVACLGSGSLYLGLLATTASRWPEAVEHFEASITEHERLGAVPFLTRTRYEYARMLLRRGEPADLDRAHELLERAAPTAQALGMTVVGAGIARLLETVPEKPHPHPLPTVVERGADPEGDVSSPERSQQSSSNTPVSQAGAEASTPDSPNVSPSSSQWGGGRGLGSTTPDRFQREGEYWTISFDGSVVRLKDSKGLRQIALLLAQPGRELHATDLETLVAGPSDAAPMATKSRAAYDEVETRPDFGDAGELLDAEARVAYKARLDELQEEIDEAEDFNDPVRAEKARDERQFLIRELARAVGLGGRDRKAASHAERARLNATRAIRAAMTNLAREHPALGQHLTATIRTGRYCSYTPDPRTPVSWAL